jgi:hypothetical protein
MPLLNCAMWTLALSLLIGAFAYSGSTHGSVTVARGLCGFLLTVALLMFICVVFGVGLITQS